MLKNITFIIDLLVNLYTRPPVKWFPLTGMMTVRLTSHYVIIINISHPKVIII